MDTKIIEEDWTPSISSSNYKPAKLARYKFKDDWEDWGSDNKDSEPLDIIENKAGEKVYEDLHLQVFVKSEAIVKDFVNNFNLSNLNNYTIWDSLCFVIYNVPSSEDTSNQYHNLLNVNKNISESNYTKNFPYVAELVFKNIWGCVLNNKLKTYVKYCNLVICYPDFFSLNPRKKTVFYNSFFDQGYIKEAKIDFGSSFMEDEILGDTKLNNYFTIHEYSYICSENYKDDQTYKFINQNNFGYRISSAFDHYYCVTPYQGIPFFKEKTFNDAFVKLLLEKKDVLGNIIQRKVNLPLNVIFTNNLIKAYFKKEDETYIEFLNSNSVNQFSVQVGSSFYSLTTVWCPNSDKLTVNSTILGGTIKEEPKLRNKNGQLCELYYEVSIEGLSAGTVIKCTHIFEYSDGENYDTFTFYKEITLKE